MSNNLDTHQPLEHNDAAVLQHMAMYQNLIARMATNSSTCKNWCIVLISAFLAFIMDKGKVDMVWVGLLPVLLFWFLDAYYLALEKQFRAASNTSAEKIRESHFSLEHLFLVKVDGKLPNYMKDSLFSYATYPLYGTLCVLLILAKLFA